MILSCGAKLVYTKWFNWNKGLIMFEIENNIFSRENDFRKWKYFPTSENSKIMLLRGMFQYLCNARSYVLEH